MMGCTKDQLLDRFKELQIDFDSINHPAVMTVEAQAKYVAHISGGLSKNLFLKDKKHRYYLISALAGTNVDLKVLSQRLGLGKGGLRMAPEEALQELLQVPLGCVTPFALINDSARSVSLLLDQGFKAHECCFFHPLTNDMTISLSPSNLDKFLNSIERKVSYVDLEANPRDGLGKDNPPDLVDLVPSEVCSLPDQTVKAVRNHVPAEKPSTNSANAHPKVAPEKSKSTIDSSTGATNVSTFVREVIEKTSAAILSELNKGNAQKLEVQCSSVTDAVKKRIASDLENLAVMLKNAAYTEGFHSGLQSALPRKNL